MDGWPMRRVRVWSLIALGVWAAPAVRAQAPTVGASAASTIPLVVDGHDLGVTTRLDRFGSGADPYTLLTTRLDASRGSAAGGFTVGIGAEEALDRPATPLVGVAHLGSWRRVGGITLHVDITSRVARLLYSPGQPVDHWIDSAGYHVPQPDTMPQLGYSHVQAWSQLETTASWQHGRFQWDAVVGARPPVAGLAAAVWGRLAGTMQVLPRVAVMAEAGSLPAQIALNAPSARFLHVGIQLTPQAGNRKARVAPPHPAAAFAVQPAGPLRYTITYRTTGEARTVEVAGDFDAWRPVPLARVGADVWRVTTAMTPGTHRISMRVDGGPWVAPPGTVAVADDFGGTVGLVQVR